jgi:ACGX-repeat protein
MNNLNMLNDWKNTNDYTAMRSAQSYLHQKETVLTANMSHGSACGSGDPGKSKPKPSSCGSSCGAGDK